MTEEQSFIEELLLEAEVKEVKLEEAHADLVLIEIRKLEKQIENNFDTAEKEQAIIAAWAVNKNAVLKERADLLRQKLKGYLQERGLKTLDLANGTLKMRKSPDKVEITDLEKFLASATGEMISVIPEQVKPDLNKLKAYIKYHKRIPDGVQLIEGTESFTIKLRTENNYESEA